MTTPDPPAIIFGDDVTGLAVLRALGRAGVPVSVAGTPSALLARSRWYRPAPGEPVGEGWDADRVADWLRALPFPGAVLFPCNDNWALTLSALPVDVAAAYPTAAAPRHVIEVLIDKERFAEAAGRFAVPTPRTLPVARVEDLDAVSDAELPSFFLKPRESQRFAERFGVKGLRLLSRGEAAGHVRRLADEGIAMVLQEFIPGPATAHVFLDGYVDRAGVMRACLARRRLRMFPPDLGNSTLSVTIPRPEVEAAVGALRRLFEGLGYAGLFDAEFKYDERDGQYKILEVNARPWWQFALSGAAGLDLARLAYEDALGRSLPPVPDYRVGRTWVHPVPDAKAWWATRHNGDAGGFPLRSWGGANALFSWDDPLPLAEEIRRLGRRAAGRSA